MSELLDRVNDLQMGYALEAQRLLIERELTSEEWERLGLRLVANHEGSLWHLGDWLVYGGGRQHEKAERWLGGSYANAARITGYSEATLSAAYVVAHAFAPTQRLPALRWSHHRAVMRLPSHRWNEVLLMAMEHNWTTDDIHRFIDTILPPSFDNRAERKTRKRQKQYHAVMHVECPQCHHVFPTKGHKVEQRVPPAPVEAADTYAEGFARKESR